MHAWNVAMILFMRINKAPHIFDLQERLEENTSSPSDENLLRGLWIV